MRLAKMAWMVMLGVWYDLQVCAWVVSSRARRWRGPSATDPQPRQIGRLGHTLTELWIEIARLNRRIEASGRVAVAYRSRMAREAMVRVAESDSLYHVEPIRIKPSTHQALGK